MSAIRARIAELSLEQLLAMLPAAGAVAEPAVVTETHRTLTETAVTVYPARRVEVVELMDGLSLTVQLDRGGLVQRVAEDIYRHYGMRR